MEYITQRISDLSDRLIWLSIATCIWIRRSSHDCINILRHARERHRALATETDHLPARELDLASLFLGILSYLHVRRSVVRASDQRAIVSCVGRGRAEQWPRAIKVTASHSCSIDHGAYVTLACVSGTTWVWASTTARGSRRLIEMIHDCWP
jgi:hypothetical protein